MSANQGYGICGAKNVYSGTALLDNWVEDRMGVQLVSQGDRFGQKFYTTNSHQTHCDPANMEMHPNSANIKLESVKDLKMRNKEGTPYDLLFSNPTSIANMSPYMTTSQLVQSKGAGARFALREGLRTSERQKRIRREDEFANNPKSVSHASSSRIPIPKAREAIDPASTEALPIWSRRALISKWAIR